MMVIFMVIQCKRKNGDDAEKLLDPAVGEKAGNSVDEILTHADVFLQRDPCGFGSS